MKYFLFAIALVGMIPLGVVASLNRKLVGAVVFCIFLPALIFNATALNFFSDEFYRGTARGMEVSFIYLLSLAVIIALALRRSLAPLLPGWGGRIILIYIIWSACSFANADDRLVAWFELWKMMMIYLVFWAMSSWMKASDDPGLIVNSMAFFVVMNFFPVIQQHFSGRYQVWGCFPHQNSMAVFLMFLLPIFFARYLVGRNSLSWRLCSAAFLFGSISIIRTYSRGAIAVYPIAAGITALLCLSRNFSQRIISRLAPIAIIGLLGFAVLLPRIIDRFIYAPESSKEDRVIYAQSACNMIADHPVLGVGLNNWGLKINPPYEYNVRDLSKVKFSDDEPYRDGVVETVYLLVAAECGLVGLFILLLLFGFYLISAFRLTRRLAGTQWFFIAAGATGGLVGCYLQSILEWSLKQQVDYIGLFIVFSLISYLNLNWKRLAEKERSKTDCKDPA